MPHLRPGATEFRLTWPAHAAPVWDERRRTHPIFLCQAAMPTIVRTLPCAMSGRGPRHGIAHLVVVWLENYAD